MNERIEKVVNEIVTESFEAGRKHGEEEKSKLEKEKAELAEALINKSKECLKLIEGWNILKNGVEDALRNIDDKNMHTVLASISGRIQEIESGIITQKDVEAPVVNKQSEYSCPKCGKKYQYVNSFRKHLKGHDYNEAEISQIELGGKQNGIPENK
jgi:predicted RNA-binding Zn-ribbon protein involved in translation (DUF1610 family)